MSYTVKEIFYTLQGEGAQTGRPAVFCRFSGCNLWSGREEDRVRAVCQFCDTDFVGTDGAGGGRFDTPDALATAVAKAWPERRGFSKPFVVCTGGEPLLQLDQPLIDALHRVGFEIAIETNGTQVASPDIDWICVSPKASFPGKRGGTVGSSFSTPARGNTPRRNIPTSPSAHTTVDGRNRPVSARDRMYQRQSLPGTLSPR